ncbi:MAG: ribose-phosphate diphosphokinase [Alphaproteobacteria bacterium]
MSARATVHGFADSRDGAERLAAALGADFSLVEVHAFPDGESRVRVAPTEPNAVIFRTLDRPNDKLIEILLAADALRDRGARRVALAAPYFPYMRQDRAFAEGEAVSQRVFGRIVAGAFDAIVTAAPHLHRTAEFSRVVPGCAARVVGAGDVLAAILGRDPPPMDCIVVGPDVEATPLARGVGDRLGLPWAVAAKERRGDTAVGIVLPDERWTGRPVLLVDDIVSTGGTLVACAEILRARGAGPIEAVACHALFDANVAERLRQAGIVRVRSADTVLHPTSVPVIAPLLAAQLRELLP